MSERMQVAPITKLSIGDAPTEMAMSTQKGFTSGYVIARRYEVMCKLGEGGMGVVYKCFDQLGGVEVAVKGLPPEVSRNDDEMEEIRTNYQIVSKLHHPNIVGARTLEKDESTGDYYLVMDLAPGVNLKSWVKRNPQAPMDVKFSILRQVASALDYAHSENIIHRDVKPENVMVLADGRVQVLDFGLAAQIRLSQSRVSSVVTSRGGTPGYKSPEQWQGWPQRESADEYSFGVLAYWLFSGELPFDGDDVAVLCQAVLTAPVRPVQGLPAHMNAALVKALAKKPEDRFANCGEFMAVLEGRVDVAIGKARKKGIPLIIIIVAALGLGAVGVWWVENSKWNGNNNKPDVSQPKHDPAPPVADGDGTSVVATASNVTIKIAPGPVASNVTTNIGDPPKPKGPVVQNGGDCHPEESHGTANLPKASRGTEGVPKNKPEVRPMPTVAFPAYRVKVRTEGNDKVFEFPSRVNMRLKKCGTNDFWMGETEVTEAQWNSVMTNEIDEATSSGGDFPKTMVSLAQCQEFMKSLREMSGGEKVSLPDSYSWVLACLAGSRNAYSWGDSPRKNGGVDYVGNFNGEVKPVKYYDYSNLWGLYDMHGNVAEWCEDGKIRGGGCDKSAEGCTASSFQKPHAGFEGNKYTGFRVFLRGGKKR